MFETINEDPFSLAYKLGVDEIKTKDVLATVVGNQRQSTENVERIRIVMDVLVPTDLGVVEHHTAQHVGLRTQTGNVDTCNLESSFDKQKFGDRNSKARNKKAPGPDDILVQVYKNLKQGSFLGRGK